MRPCRQLKRNFEPPPVSEFRYIEGYSKALVFILAFSINLLAFYHERRPLIGYATQVLFCDR